MPTEIATDPAWFEGLPDRPRPRSASVLDPPVEPFFGCRPHTRAAVPSRGRPGRIPEAFAVDGSPVWTGYRSAVPASEDVPPGEPCANCGAVRDARGRVLTIPVPEDMVEAAGVVAVATGVHAGDDGLICGRCLCLSPAKRSQVAAGTSPRPRRLTKAEQLAARRVPRPRPKLTGEQRKGIVADAPARLRAVARAFVAREDAIAAGDLATADALAALLATAGEADPKSFAREFRRIRKAASDGTPAGQ